METFSTTEHYLDILRFISEKTGIDIQKLKNERRFPAVAYRHLVFSYFVKLGYTQQYISEVTGYSRPTVSCGVSKANRYGDTIIVRNFRKLMEEYENEL